MKNKYRFLVIEIIILILLTITSLYVTTDINKLNSYKAENKDEEKTSKNMIKEIKYKDYKFKYNQFIDSEVKNDKLLFENEKIKATVILEEGNFEQLESKEESLLSKQLEVVGYDIKEANIEKKEYGEKKFIIIKNIKTSTNNIDISYTKASENELFVTSITNSNKTPENEKDRIYQIISTTKKS